MSSQPNKATNNRKNEIEEDDSNTTWIWLVVAFVIMIAVGIYTS